MNDHSKEIVRHQIQTHYPEWISELFNACTNKEVTFLKMVEIYEQLSQDNAITFDINNYKKEIFEHIHPQKHMKSYSFYTRLLDTSHAMIFSKENMLVSCHEIFWLHIKNQIKKTNHHSYDLLFHDDKLKALFEDWIYELDIDLTSLNETSLLYQMIKEIKESIDFSSHPTLYKDILQIEKECQESLNKPIAC